MKKERIKDIVLIALVLCSLLLTGKIWLNDKLWPDGYNFFTQLHGKFSALFSDETTEDTRNLLSPAHMIAYTVKNSDHASYAVTKSNENYLAVRSFCDETLATALAQPQKNITAVDEAAWKNALFTNGMYLDYGTNIPGSVFCALSGVSTQTVIAGIAPNIRYAIITSEGNIVSNIVVYLRDAQNNSFKIATQQSKASLTTVLDSLKDYVTPNNRFSFFIGADTATSEMGEVLFNSYLLLTENETQLPGLSVQNPIYEDGSYELSQSFAEKLLRCFSMNPKTAKKYTDAEENIIFLQNQSTLKISKSGHVEYTAATGQNGFALPETNSMDHAALARGAVGLIYDVYNVFSDQPAQLYMTDLAVSDAQFNLGLDYNINGAKVITDLSGAHAASIQIVNGYVQHVSVLLRAYAPTEQLTTLPSSYTAVDRIFAQLETDNQNTVIENMFIGYYDRGANAELQPTWFIKLEDEAELMLQE